MHGDVGDAKGSENRERLLGGGASPGGLFVSIEQVIELIKTLDAADEQTLSGWWKQLNSWQWPTALGEEESPNEYVGRENPRNNTRRGLLMAAIEERVPMRVLVRTWNSEMREEEFEKWFARYMSKGKEKPNG